MMQWKSIKDYEGYYEVSDTGLVRSLDRVVPDKQTGQKRLKGKQMKLTETQNTRGGQGYYVVNLRRNHKSNIVPVHRLVAETFLENKHNLPTVNHKDGNKHNNCIDNLEWATYSYNNVHALRNNLRRPRGVSVVQISRSGKVIGAFRSVCEASRLTGINRSAISHCLNHRSKYAGGYQWQRVGKCNDYLANESTVEDELPLEVQEREILEDIVCANGNI